MAMISAATDEQLVARAAAQDADALSALYDRHRATLFSMALRILRDRAEAEEVLGDVFLQAWRQSASYEPARGSVAGWLVNLCRSRAIDRVRARGRRAAGEESLAREEEARAGAPDGPLESAVGEQRRRRVLEALSALGPEQRRALEMAYYGGLSHSEIAAELGQPLGTVKTRIRQAILVLRDRLGESFDV
jgi:RNA polymerase sigma-70 factor (ECF subfamily)